MLWRRRQMSEYVASCFIAIFVGILAGVGAWFLKWSIGGLTRFFLSLTDPAHGNWFLFVLPILGIVLTSLYQRYWVGYPLEHGVSQIHRSLARHHYRIRPGFCYQPILANVMTLGLGGSAGAEGPIATVGAAIGSLIARATGLSPERVKTMIGIGAGAGIAGIFKSPIGGALFTLEVFRMKLDTISVLTLFLSTLCAGITTYALTDFTFNIQVDRLLDFDMALLGWAVGLGVFLGFYSIYYNKITNMMLRLFNGMSNIWLRNILSGTIVGLCLLCFPSMFGEGYIFVTQLVNGDTSHVLSGSIFACFSDNALIVLLLMVLLILLKAFATVSTNSGGGVAGDFAPTIFAGAFAGLVFAWAMNMIFDVHLSPAVFAFLGTAGAFAGIIHAPLMATFLVAEMPGDGFIYFFPLALVSFISFLTSKIFTIFDRDRGENISISPNLPSKSQPNS